MYLHRDPDHRGNIISCFRSHISPSKKFQRNSSITF